MKRTSLLIIAAALLLVRCAPAKPNAAQLQTARQANRLGVARMLWYEQGYQWAIESFETALKANPNYFEARYNLGLAHFERGNEKDKHDFTEALKNLELAARMQPKSPAASFTRGLVLIKLDRLDEALAALKQALAADPNDPDTNYWVGSVLADQEKHAEALPFLQRAVALRQWHRSANYRLAMTLQVLGKTAEAKAAFERFQQLSSHPGLFPKNIEQYYERGKYARALEEPVAEPPAPEPAKLKINAVTNVAPIKGNATKKEAEGRLRSEVGDVNGDGAPDVLFVTNRVWLLVNDGKARFKDITAESGLASVRGAQGALLGDLNNDGRLDLFLRGVGMFLQGEKGVFHKAPLPVKPVGEHVMFVDLDHDGDLEIILSDPKTGVTVLRNLGKAQFAEATKEFGLDGIKGANTGCAADLNGDRLTDLIFGGPTGLQVFYNDWSGKFQKTQVLRDFNQGPIIGVAAGDVTGDGWTDILATTEKSVWLFTNLAGSFESKQLSHVGGSLAIADFDNDGWPDVLTSYNTEMMWLRGRGAGDFEETPPESGLSGMGEFPWDMIVADFDENGFPDVFWADFLYPWDGVGGPFTQIQFNQGNSNHWVRLQLEGMGDSASNRQAVGTRVEVVAGPIARAVEVQCTESAAATPTEPVLVGIGAQPEVDYVRLSWTSGTHAVGLPQARMDSDRQPAQQVEFGPAGQIPVTPENRKYVTIVRTNTTTHIGELNRKESSCPLLFAWDGTQYRFVTDIQGNNLVGAWRGPGAWSVGMPSEFLNISDLAPIALRDGRYSLQIANPWQEVLHLDEVHLVAVDHPAGVAVWPEGRFQFRPPPPAPLQLYAMDETRPLARVLDAGGQDVTALAAQRDRRFLPITPRGVSGFAEPWSFTLDLGAVPTGAPGLYLTLHGFLMWPHSNDIYAAAERRLPLSTPMLEAQQADGRWRTVVPDTGLPCGLPKTIVVDLSGRLRPGEHLLRMSGTFEAYFDEIRIGARRRDAQVRGTELPLTEATLHETGFLEPLWPDGKEPVVFQWGRTTPELLKPTYIGFYSKLGAVTELLAAQDDVYAISRPGEAIQCDFDAAKLPPLPAGWARTLILHTWSWGKDYERNNATRWMVEPLPYFGMTAYPPTQPYPLTTERARLMNRYNTRWVGRPE